MEKEGILFSADGRVDLKRYGWDPSRDLSSEELHTLLTASSDNPVVVSEGLLRHLRNDPASPFRTAPAGETA